MMIETIFKNRNKDLTKKRQKEKIHIVHEILTDTKETDTKERNVIERDMKEKDAIEDEVDMIVQVKTQVKHLQLIRHQNQIHQTILNTVVIVQKMKEFKKQLEEKDKDQIEDKWNLMILMSIQITKML